MKIASFFVIFSLFSCSNLEDKLIQFKSEKIEIPYESMSVYNCSMYTDTIKHPIMVVKYIDSVNCGQCVAFDLLKTEELISSLYGDCCGLVCIIGGLRNSNILKEFYDSHVQSMVCLDTCNVFLEVNPQIPDNELFHTFVINKDGKVLMVGNPFQNEKMEALFKKVIANERKKHKTKKPA